MKRAKVAKQRTPIEKGVVFIVRSAAKNFAPVESPNLQGSYTGYFRNASDESFVIDINRRARTGTIRPVDGSPVVHIANDSIVGHTVLSQDEAGWATACWHAATGQELRPAESSEAMWRERARQRAD